MFKIVHLLLNFSAGGAEIVAIKLAKYMSKYYNVEFIVFTDTVHYNINNCKINIINKKDFKNFLLEKNYDLIINHYHWSKDHLDIVKIIQDINIPLIMLDHSSYNFHLLTNNTCVHKLRLPLYKKANRLIVLNQQTADDYNKFADIDATVIHNPVVIDNIIKTSSLSSLNIVSVANFTKEFKHIEALLKTLSLVNIENNFAVLHVVGSYNNEQVNALLNKYNINRNNIFFHGLLKHDDILKIYSVSSVYAMTSEIEGFPTVLTEAAQHKIPIVAMDIKGVTNEVFKDKEDAFFVPQNDCKAMAEKILLLLDNKELRLTMGNSAYNKTKDLSIEVIGEKWIKLINDVLEEVK